jgi:hypothetical protein
MFSPTRALRLGVAAVLAATLMTSVPGAAGTTSTPRHQSARITTSYQTSSHGLILNVVNTSSHTLRWMDDQNMSPTNTPKPLLHPGETDRLVYKASMGRMSIRPTWQIDDTKFTVFPAFSVPSVGANGYSCTPNDMSSYQSPVGPTHCDIGNGWEPDAHLTLGDRTPR